jgi:hypothetical protein
MQRRRTAEQWKEILADFKRSGLSQERFCKREGIASATFYEWNRKLNFAPAPATLATRPGGFVEVCLPSQPPPVRQSVTEPLAEVVVELPYGVVLRFRGIKA